MLLPFFMPGATMRKLFSLLIVFSCLPLFAQTSATAKPTPKSGPKSAAKPAAPAGPPTAIIDTTAGKMTCMLFPDKAPIGVANFVGLSRGTKDWRNPANGKKMHGVPLYNGTIFHRVIPEFMIQGGDPMGTGMGDPGYKFKNETSPDLLFDRPGRLAYANAGPDTNGSQFFITEVPYPSLNGGYTIFGQCDDPSVEIVKQIARLPRNPNDRPDDPPKINKITILHYGGAHAPVHHPAPKPAAPKTSKPH
jgi:peptidyl-prolyl cis-trans isomerase A (cyclophilin A)